MDCSAITSLLNMQTLSLYFQKNEQTIKEKYT